MQVRAAEPSRFPHPSEFFLRLGGPGSHPGASPPASTRPIGRLAPEPVDLGASGCVRCTGERLAFRVGLLFWRKQGGKGFQEQLLKEGRVALWKKEWFFRSVHW